MDGARRVQVSGTFEDPTFVDTLYTYGLFFTFFVAGIAAYLALSTIGSRTTEVGQEPETT